MILRETLSTAGGDVRLESSCPDSGLPTGGNALVRTYPLPSYTCRSTMILIIIVIIIGIMSIMSINFIRSPIMIIIIIVIALV
jgi:hypothetical protein